MINDASRDTQKVQRTNDASGAALHPAACVQPGLRACAIRGQHAPFPAASECNSYTLYLKHISQSTTRCLKFAHAWKHMRCSAPCSSWVHFAQNDHVKRYQSWARLAPRSTAQIHMHTRQQSSSHILGSMCWETCPAIAPVGDNAQARHCTADTQTKSDTKALSARKTRRRKYIVQAHLLGMTPRRVSKGTYTKATGARKIC